MGEDESALLEELLALLQGAGVEVRCQYFDQPPKNAGGLCQLYGQRLVLLDSGAQKAEHCQVLLEAAEQLGLAQLGRAGSDLSPGLLARLNRRGRMPWPHPAQAPSVAKTSATAPEKNSTVSLSSPLSMLTTMQVGGAAEELITVETEKDLIGAATEACKQNRPLHVLGGGSNIVAADAGVKGVVLLVRTRGISVERDGDWATVTAQAGENWDALVSRVTDEGLAGIHCLGGIPGRVGATPIQNVGAYGQEVSQSITQVRVFDRRTGQLAALSAEQCEFSYRDSLFKSKRPDRYIVLSVAFKLKVARRAALAHRELWTSLAQKDPAISDVLKRVIELRRAKSMVLDESDENTRSCGSFFVNAMVSARQLEHINAVAGTEAPCYRQSDDLFKVPSAWLIERSGLKKGHRQGAVGLSTKHTLCVVAHPGATAHAIVEFAGQIRDRVQATFAVRLIPEPNFWGFPHVSDGLPA